jgi:hypothetical protein
MIIIDKILHMKKIFTLLAICLNSFLFAQSFNSPESVEYDAMYNRWLVGNNGDGTIVSYYPASNTTINFCSGLSSGPHGIEIMGSTAYVCDGGRVKGYDLLTGSQVFNLNLSASFLNGLTSDGSTYLFATDFSAKKIYRINPAANAFNLMTTTVKTPNGIYYDGANNRCVFVTWGSNAAVQAMSLSDSTISTLLATTLGNMDGVTRDNAGFWYFTTWSNNSLNRADPTFSSGSVVVMSALSSPADIDINAAGDSIGIPNSGSANNVVFYTGITTGLNSATVSSFQLFPNPANDCITIVNESGNNNTYFVLTNIAGQAVLRRTISNNSHQVELFDLPTGIYMAELFDENGIRLQTQKLVLAR